MKTSVVIPCYNHYDLLHQILWDLYKNCKDEINEVIVVNNGSTDSGWNDGLEGFWFKQKLLPIKVVYIKDNIGFLLAANKGMSVASGEVLILISNDVRIYGNVVRTAKEILFTYPNDAVGGKLLNFDTGWNTFDGVTYPYLEGWLLGCTKELWQKTGGFDEQFAPSDMEDVDWSTTVKKLGGSLIEIKSSFEHIGAQTYGYNPEREARTIKNKEKFRKKWVN